MPHWKHIVVVAGFLLVAAVTLLWSNTGNAATHNLVTKLAQHSQFRGRRRFLTKNSSKTDSPSELTPGNFSEGGLITNFWLEKNRPSTPHLPPDLKRARDDLRAVITALQHPDDCSTAKICTCGYPMKGGLFSMLHGRGLCLLNALANNCTLVDAPGVEDKIVHKHAYIDQNACALDSVDSPFECYFQPLSTCAFDKARRVRLYSRDSCDRFDELFSQVSQRFGISSKLLLQTEMMSYIMRPNHRLHNSILEHGERMQLSSRANLSQCLAVHIRHTDKHGVPASEKLHTQFVGAADDLRKLYGFDVINYMTDDPGVDTLFKVRFSLLRTVRSSPQSVLLTRSACIFWTIWRQVIPEVDPQVRVTTMSAAVRRKVMDEDDSDVGLPLLSHAMIMAQCPMLLGSQVSNVDRAVLELMGTMSWPPAMVDMYGDLYAPCATWEAHTNFTQDSEPFYAEEEAELNELASRQ
eukprot:INCI4977.12.p1 GENE.INCI4977.12~~INCI4977.12.p1  ORF type:complete len:509 (-),score=53.05 INCI4977.12:1487-2884(-)